MVEQSERDEERKARLIAELERSRSGLARDLRGMRRSLDVGAHLKSAILRQKTLWFTGAAVTGWLLTRLPGRRKKQEAEPKPSRWMPKAKESSKGGWILTLLGLAGTLLKPAITSYLSQKIEEMSLRGPGGHAAPRPMRQAGERRSR